MKCGVTSKSSQDLEPKSSEHILYQSSKWFSSQFDENLHVVIKS